MKSTILLFASVIIALYSCKPSNDSKNIIELGDNPPIQGFNIDNSDPEAIMIADKVMTAMGGRKAWDETRLICWTFFNKRRLVWDKHSGDVRITNLDSDQITIVNIHTLEGQVFKDGQKITQPDSLARYLKLGKSIWINDSYWLVMPFKLKDTGVSLHYIGEDTLDNGRNAYTLQMSFENVGDTPDNIYNIWVDVETDLISKWAFFKSSEDADPAFSTPWLAYKKYNKILLSGSRGKGNMGNIKVLETVPKATFTTLDKIDI